MEHSLLGTFAPVELSFLRSEGSKNFRSVELYYHENEYFTNFRYKCHKTCRVFYEYKPYIAYVHQSPAVNNFQQLICRQRSAGAKALSTGNYQATIASRVITSRVHQFVNFSAINVALT